MMEHRGSLDIALLPVPPVFDPETVFEITIDPHFADNVTIQRHIRRGDELDQESRCCRQISKDYTISARWDSPNATTVEMTTEVQNGTFPNKITTSSVKSLLSKKE